MLTDAEIDGLRATSQLALPDQCVITRPGQGGGTIHPTTLVLTPATGSTVYSGACRVRPPSAEEFETVFGDTEVTEQRYVGTFPADLPAVAIGDVVTVTTSSDPHITGRSFRVTRVAGGSWLIDRRLGLEVTE